YTHSHLHPLLSFPTRRSSDLPPVPFENRYSSSFLNLYVSFFRLPQIYLTRSLLGCRCGGSFGNRGIGRDLPVAICLLFVDDNVRSEERRVGKEGSWLGWTVAC